MTTLAEYAHQHFPQHPVDSADGAVPLSGHTVVAHIIGRERGEMLEAAARRDLGGTGRITSLVIAPTHGPAGRGKDGEDPEGIFDLPNKRWAGGAIAGGVAIGLLVGVIGGIISDSVIAGVLLGVFGALIGGWIGSLFSGIARYGGNRAWEQEHAPNDPVVLVAVMLDDEAEANRAAAVLSRFNPDDVRILNTDGSWHSPNI